MNIHFSAFALRVGFTISVTVKVPITLEPSYISKHLPIHNEFP